MMHRVLSWLPMQPRSMRVALSAGMGIALGMLFAGSPAWLAWALLILVLRTHLPVVALGWLAGWLVSVPLSHGYETIGARILLVNEPFWRALLVKPMICLFTSTRRA